MATIMVKSIRGATTPITGLDLSATTVKQFKERLATELSMPVESQRVIFSGRVLEDDKTLSECGLANECTVHVVAIQRRAEPAAPAASAASAPATSLFAPAQPTSGAGSGSPGGAGGMPPELAQMLQNPQVAQILQNPAMLRQLIQANPDLMQIPQVAQLLQNPEMLQQLMSGGGGFGGMGAPRPWPAVPRNVFDDAMACLGGADVPDQYPNPVRESADSGPAPEWREIITREQCNTALDQVMSDLGLAPSAQPQGATSAGEPDVGSAMEVAPDGATVPAAEAPSGEMETAADPEPYADQIRQLKEMGFTNELQIKQALEAAGGEIMTAMAFLTGD